MVVCLSVRYKLPKKAVLLLPSPHVFLPPFLLLSLPPAVLVLRLVRHLRLSPITITYSSSSSAMLLA